MCRWMGNCNSLNYMSNKQINFEKLKPNSTLIIISYENKIAKIDLITNIDINYSYKEIDLEYSYFDTLCLISNNKDLYGNIQYSDIRFNFAQLKNWLEDFPKSDSLFDVQLLYL